MFNWFRRNKEAEVKYLIVGLGNIGPDYVNTRHNIGFDVVDAWASKHGAEFESGRLAYVSKLRFRGKQVILIKPTTFMNLSGKAVKHWMSKEKIDPSHILVITDDLALPLGKIRLRAKGGHAGHNGLRDIIAQLGTELYARLKFGIGDNFPRGRQVDHVLGKWKGDEEADVAIGIEKACETIESFLSEGLERAMNKMN